MANKPKEYLKPTSDKPRDIEHYHIVSPILDVMIQYDISRAQLHEEIVNVTGEDIGRAAFISWMRRTEQKWTPPFRVIQSLNQVFQNILIKKGFKFTSASRFYYEIVPPNGKTKYEEELIKEIYKLRSENEQLKNKILVSNQNSG